MTDANQLRAWVDAEIESLDRKMDDLIETAPAESWGTLVGMRYMALKIKAAHLLTPEERAESERVRWEMFND